MLNSKSEAFSKISLGTKIVNKKNTSRTNVLKKANLGTFLFKKLDD